MTAPWLLLLLWCWLPVPEASDVPQAPADLLLVPWVPGTDNMPLTVPMQQRIFRHQHPADCRAQAFLLWHLHNWTLAADLHMLSWGLAKAMNEGKVLILASGWAHAAPGGFEHFFQPLTNCTLEDAAATAARNADSRAVPLPDKVEWEWANPRHQAPRPTCELLHGWDRMGVSWWRAQTTRYFVRPQAWLEASPGATAEALGLRIPPDTVSMAFHTDEPYDTMPYSAKLEDFFEEAENVRALKPQVRTVFLTARDPAVVAQARGKWGGRWDILTLAPEAALVPPAPPDERTARAHRTLVELNLHLQCDYFVVTRLSHFTRLIDEVRVTSGKFNRLVIALNGPPQYGKIG